MICTTIAELPTALAPLRASGIAMVPTMGALHDGHLSLVREARRHAAAVVVSIFVNPTQFAPHEDFDAYPRNLEADVAKLASLNASPVVIFAPTAREMYPEGFSTSVTVGGPALGLESDFRPHFFTGVATVVAKLLLAALPGYAVFGEKDYQQLQVVRRLAMDLGLPTRIIAAPTAREADGLAMSSRNVYLDARERAIAGNLNLVMKDVIARSRGSVSPSALRIASAATGISPASADARAGDGCDLRDAEAFGTAALLATGFDSVDYVAIRDAESLALIQGLEKPARLLVAAKVGKIRLIDNMEV